MPDAPPPRSRPSVPIRASGGRSTCRRPALRLRPARLPGAGRSSGPSTGSATCATDPKFGIAALLVMALVAGVVWYRMGVSSAPAETSAGIGQRAAGLGHGDRDLDAGHDDRSGRTR